MPENRRRQVDSSSSRPDWAVARLWWMLIWGLKRYSWSRSASRACCSRWRLRGRIRQPPSSCAVAVSIPRVMPAATAARLLYTRARFSATARGSSRLAAASSADSGKSRMRSASHRRLRGPFTGAPGGGRPPSCPPDRGWRRRGRRDRAGYARLPGRGGRGGLAGCAVAVPSASTA